MIPALALTCERVNAEERMDDCPLQMATGCASFDVARSRDSRAMDYYRKEALRQCHPYLRTVITVGNILPSLHVDAGEFLNDEENDSIAKNVGNVDRVDDLVDILLKKENKDFDYFCVVLEKEGCQACSKRLRGASGLGK